LPSGREAADNFGADCNHQHFFIEKLFKEADVFRSLMYDVCIIGGGPAGITAAIYSARYRLSTLLISPDIGGWTKKAHRIENYPSHVSVIGKELAKRYEEHIAANELAYKKERVSGIAKDDSCFTITTNAGVYQSKFIIYAMGTKKRMLNIPGEQEFLGKGVCLCATCDAPFFKNKNVAVLGGNDSGATSALLIAEYAAKVYVCELMPKLPAEPIWQKKMQETGKIEVICGDCAAQIAGDRKVTKLTMKSGKEIPVDGVFIEVGSDPDNSLAKAVGTATDRWGHIEVDRTQMSSVDRLYASGDVTNGSNYMRQIVAAQAEGAIAAQSIYRRIMKGE
jgi:thioredoxin reductase (NADPH)